MRIKDMNSEQRPREKALRYGLQSLSDEELVCLLIGSGTLQADVIHISREFLETTDQLANLFDVHLHQLTEIQGIGKSKALSLLGGVELARRALKVQTYRRNISQAEDVVKWLQTEYGGRSQEHLVGLYIDGKGKIITHKVLAIGTMDQMVTHPRELFREACLCRASSILFAHNHPSGDVRPSLADIKTTRRLMDTARIVGIPVIDHVIVSAVSWFSFARHGLLMESDDYLPDPYEDPENENEVPSV